LLRARSGHSAKIFLNKKYFFKKKIFSYFLKKCQNSSSSARSQHLVKIFFKQKYFLKKMIFHYFFRKMPKLFAEWQITALGKNNFSNKKYVSLKK